MVNPRRSARQDAARRNTKRLRDIDPGLAVTLALFARLYRKVIRDIPDGAR